MQKYKTSFLSQDFLTYYKLDLSKPHRLIRSQAILIPLMDQPKWTMNSDKVGSIGFHTLKQSLNSNFLIIQDLNDLLKFHWCPRCFDCTIIYFGLARLSNLSSCISLNLEFGTRFVGVIVCRFDSEWRRFVRLVAFQGILIYN